MTENRQPSRSTAELFAAAAAFGLRRPTLALSLAGAIVLLSVLSGLGMRFRAEVSDLVPAASADVFRKLEEVFGAADNAFLLVQSPSNGAQSSLVELARAIAARLERDPLVRSVTFGWSELADRLVSADLLALAPLLARPEDIQALERLLTPEGIAASVRKQAASLGLPGLGQAEKWIERDPLELRSFLLGRLAGLRGAFRTRAGSMDLVSEDGRAVLIRIEGTARTSDIPAVKAIVRAARVAVEEARASLRTSRPEVADFDVGLTGGYAFAAESEETLRGDITRNIALSLALVLGLFACTLRRPVLGLVAAVPVLAGIAAGFGLFSIFRREVVTLSLVSGAILAGLGIDFAIHFTLRVFSDPRGPTRTAVLDAARVTGPSSLFAALTTAAAFLSFRLTGEKFLGDLGLLSACGILCCMGATHLLLPAALAPWIARAERGTVGDAERGSVGAGRKARPPRRLGAELLARPGIARPWTVLGVSLSLGAASMVYLLLRPPDLETDLRNVQPARSEAVRTEERIHEVFGGGGEPVLILVEASAGQLSPDPEIAAVDSAARLEGELGRLLDRGVIAAWSSPSRLVPSVGESRAVLSILERTDPAAMEAALRSALEEEGFDPSRFEAAAGTLRRVLSRREPITPADLRRAGLESELDRLLGAAGGTGYALVAVHPTGEMWTAAGQKVVFDALEGAIQAARVKGDLAGAHVVSARSAAAIVRELAAATAVACLAVVILVASLFRGFVHSALALLPVTLGTLVTAALCGLLGYKLNFMNVGILPMIVGIGVDDGIHMVKQYLDQPHRSAALVVRSTGAAVMLTSITTLAAFGTMAFSVNRGLASVGVISAIGVTACLLASIVTLPAALELHSRRGRRQNS